MDLKQIEHEMRRIRVTGVVQGVGYRPFVYKLAHRYGLSGSVLNDTEGVLVEVTGPVEVLERFTTELRTAAPALARVDEVRVDETRTLGDPPAGPDGDQGFVIVASRSAATRAALVPPDTHVCADCLAELRDPADRRYRYPFINCTNCGPRYSIVQDLPYDRAKTTMAGFTMCPPCAAEYQDPSDRRYHAQPNACPACGPQLLLAGPTGTTLRGDAALRHCVDVLAGGGIAAIKSVGGFHLAVDATDAEAVGRLRRRKRRDSKPFAVMARDLTTAHRLVQLSPAEVDLLRSPARPILLARKRAGALAEGVAPRNPNLGIMLPSAPHHHLLLDEADLGVLVMTSGNISGYPIAYRNEDALDQLFDIADVVLYHDRDIEIRVDDSVVRLSTHPDLRKPVLTFLRRARGYAPYPVDVGRPLKTVVGYGAELKTTVALSSGSRVYLSQHIGDLKNDETFESHQRTAAHLANLYDLRPELGAYDMHPQFRSSVRAAAGDGPEAAAVELVQHHHAHMASCMAENQFTGPTLGVVFDGAGFGEDGTVWGGEFLLGDYATVQRVARLRPVPLIGGDQAVREPIRTGLALALDAFGNLAAATTAFRVLDKLSQQQRHVYSRMIARGVNCPMSSGMGRLFDGVAALVDVCQLAEYEAQGPIELEGLLERDHMLEAGYRFGLVTGAVTELDPRPVVRRIADDLAAGVGLPRISRRFHTAVVNAVRWQCRTVRADTGINQIVLSGGVYLNEFLLVNCLVALEAEGFTVGCHRQVPANDGGIALGQVMVADARARTTA